MNIKKLAPYIGAAIMALVAIVAVIKAVGSFDGSSSAWGQVSASVTQLEAASKLTEDTAIQNKDYTACVVAKSATGVIHSVGESALAAKDGKCHIPAVSVDVSACIALKPVVDPAAPAVVDAPVVAPTPAPVKGAPVVDAAPPVVDAAPPVVAEAPPSPELGVLVKAATAPVVALAQGLVTKADADPMAKAWGMGVISWIESGVPSIVALVEAPTNGKLTFEGQDIAGCTP